MIKNTKYEKYDACYATIKNPIGAGVILELDNGENAFAFSFSSLKEGTKVICTILKEAKEGLLTKVSIDSITQYAAI